MAELSVAKSRTAQDVDTYTTTHDLARTHTHARTCTSTPPASRYGVLCMKSKTSHERHDWPRETRPLETQLPCAKGRCLIQGRLLDQRSPGSSEAAACRTPRLGRWRHDDPREVYGRDDGRRGGRLLA